jgi:ATP-dependent helicase HepA
LPTYVPGQRWISETEPELGLGIVLSVDGNQVTVLFIAASDRRIYAAQNAPLQRVRFMPGDRIENQQGRALMVDSVLEKDSILTYQGTDEEGMPAIIEEMDLNHFLQFNKPQERLFTGQLDTTELFNLRHETLGLLAQLEQSPVRGLCGGRTSPIPHQLYIAHEVARRESPRVLLADEVGLGKTIEAGLIMHQQLLTGRAERVLIVVPEPLLHQWLVEMRRRFNLRFSLFVSGRYQESDDENPFLSEQLVLCSLAFLMANRKQQQDVLTAGWDLCVVDEAHHLGWSRNSISPEYALIEAIGAQVPGLLLLTATPEQLGKEGHFARLRLLDPDRFHDYDSFLAEESDYTALASVIQHLLDDALLNTETLGQLKASLSQDLADDLLNRIEDPATNSSARQELIQLLLDRHGTGRILFRNTRATIKGFPGRQLLATALPLPHDTAASLRQPGLSLEQAVQPETVVRAMSKSGAEWWRADPRVDWLIKTLRVLRPAKALVICAQAETAMDLEDALRVAGIRAAVFHEGLSIIARDRAAAWFAESEDGAQVLVCSEIGSEGRNFQFAHHLVLFDLPLNPDLLEQRIGRLDRIGQTETIRIHLGFFENSPQQALYRWYHESLNAFEQLNPAAQKVHASLFEKLQVLLLQPDQAAEDRLIEAARELSTVTQAILHEGRDRLLELNSCREDEADALVAEVLRQDADPALWPYLEKIFDAYGVSVEEHSALCHILRTGEHMRMQFPELPDEGVTVTLDRSTGLAREDLLFLTWEHPMVRGAIDLILNSEHGNAALSVLRHPDLDPGQLLIESFHVVECTAPRGLHLARFFPPRLIRSLHDHEGTDLSHLPADSFTVIHRQFDREHALELLRSQRQRIEKALQLAEIRAKSQLPGIIDDSGKRMLTAMTHELKRLAALRKVNPNVRQEELDQLKANALEMHECIQSARQRLDAVRVIVTA